MKIIQLLSGCLLVVAASSSSALTLASSTFTTGRQGWSVENGAVKFEWVSSGGVSGGGYVRATDFGVNSLWFFSASPAFLGDKSSALGGSLSFALKSDSGTKPPLSQTYADVQLLGNNGVRLAFSANALPTNDWTFYTVPLVANGAWRVDSLTGQVATSADLQGVLSSLLSVRIRGDYRQSIETTGLDSVLMTSAVPEVGSGMLMLAGAGVLAGLLRRRAPR